MKGRYFKSAALSVGLRILPVVLAIWLLAVAVLTLAVSQLYMELLLNDMSAIQDELPRSVTEEKEYLERYEPQYIMRLFGRVNQRSRYQGGNISGLLAPPEVEYERAFALFSTENELLLTGGDGYMTFKYSTDFEKIGNFEVGTTFIDLTALDIDLSLGEEFEEWWETGVKNDWRCMFRFIGHFDGTEFIPQRIEYDLYMGYSGNYYEDWMLLYEAEGGVSNGAVTIYADELEFRTMRAPGLEYKDENYANLGELLSTVRQTAASRAKGVEFFGRASIDVCSLREVLLFDVMEVKAGGAEEQTVYYLPYVMRAQPLKLAVERLGAVYIACLIAALLLALLLLWWLNRHFILPVRALRRCVEEGWYVVAPMLKKHFKWKDADRLKSALWTEREE